MGTRTLSVGEEKESFDSFELGGRYWFMQSRKEGKAATPASTWGQKRGQMGNPLVTNNACKVNMQ